MAPSEIDGEQIKEIERVTIEEICNALRAAGYTEEEIELLMPVAKDNQYVLIRHALKMLANGRSRELIRKIIQGVIIFAQMSLDKAKELDAAVDAHRNALPSEA